MLQIILFALLVGVLVYFVIQKILGSSAKKYNWPPGPTPWPIVGNLPQIVQTDFAKPYAAFAKLGGIYGPVMKLQLGGGKTVQLTGYEIIKQAAGMDELLERVDTPVLRMRTFGKRLGILFGEVDCWRETRRFSLRILRDFGFGKKQSMETIINDEVKEFLNQISEDSESNATISMKRRFDPFIVNTVFALVFGYRMDHNDATLKELLRLVHVFMANMKEGDIIQAFPAIAPLFPVYHRFKKIHAAVQEFFAKAIAEIRIEGSYKTDPENFVAVFLQKIDEERDGKMDEIYNDENLISVLYDFFLAGSETTSTTLEFCLLHVVLNPQVQEKLTKEIDEVLGSTRWATVEDKANMPYTEAVMMETLRRATVLPIGPRFTINDVTIGGYTIPKRVLVGFNYYSVHMDEKYWGDPNNFRPERFIGPDGKLCNFDRLMPFSLGKRSCLGESLARMTLFSFITKIFQNYTISYDEAEGTPSTEPLVGATVVPKPYKLRFHPR